MFTVIQCFEDSMATTSSWLKSSEFENFSKFCSLVGSTLQEGNKILIFGNGGSAAEAAHIAAEFVGKCVVDTGALPAICLNDSIAAVTAIANDWGYDFIFSRQIKAHALKGDLVIGLSTSGNSFNVLQGLSTAKEIGCITSLWTSRRFNGTTTDLDFVFKAPTDSTTLTQELHLQMGHALAEYVESK